METIFDSILNVILNDMQVMFFPSTYFVSQNADVNILIYKFLKKYKEQIINHNTIIKMFPTTSEHYLKNYLNIESLIYTNNYSLCAKHLKEVIVYHVITNMTDPITIAKAIQLDNLCDIFKICFNKYSTVYQTKRKQRR